jgi:hypothetical protein
LAALSTTVGNSDPLQHEEKVWLAVALVLFVLSAIAALATNFPLKYEVVKTKEIEARPSRLRDLITLRRAGMG